MELDTLNIISFSTIGILLVALIITCVYNHRLKKKYSGYQQVNLFENYS